MMMYLQAYILLIFMLMTEQGFNSFLIKMICITKLRKFYYKLKVLTPLIITF